MTAAVIWLAGAGLGMFVTGLFGVMFVGLAVGLAGDRVVAAALPVLNALAWLAVVGLAVGLVFGGVGLLL